MTLLIRISVLFALSTVLLLVTPYFAQAQSCSAGYCSSDADCLPDEECIGSFGSCSGECYLRGGGGGINPEPLAEYSTGIIAFINNILVPLLLTAAFIVFVWGVFRYLIWGAENEDDRSKGKQLVLWAVIGFAAIFSVWGLVNLVGSTLLPGGASETRPPYPTL